MGLRGGMRIWGGRREMDGKDVEKEESRRVGDRGKDALLWVDSNDATTLDCNHRSGRIAAESEIERCCQGIISSMSPREVPCIGERLLGQSSLTIVKGRLFFSSDCLFSSVCFPVCARDRTVEKPHHRRQEHND